MLTGWEVERAEFNTKTKAAIYANAGGKCQSCGCQLSPNSGEYDHVFECWEFEAGEADNSEANGQLLCPPCHKAKSKLKRAALVKVRRLRKKASGTAKKTKHKINNGAKLQSRPMPKTKRKIQSRPWGK